MSRNTRLLTLAFAGGLSFGAFNVSPVAAFPNNAAAVMGAAQDNVIEVRGRGGGGFRGGGGMRGGGVRGAHFAGGGRYGGGRGYGYGGRYAGRYWAGAALGAAAGAAVYGAYSASYQCGYYPYPACPQY